MRSLDRIGERLTAHLNPCDSAPLAIGLSGGGDSLALLLVLHDWSRAHGRRVLALTVDHGLQTAGAAWALWCAARCAKLGVDHQVLEWSGMKPTSGLSAKARAARHALLADAARSAGAKVLLLGHTADDILEAEQMRAEGSTVGDPGEWVPSPAWPQGRDVFVFRPLLKTRRATLRDWLRVQGESWVEDPANSDLTSARARARRQITEALPPPPELTSPRPQKVALQAFEPGHAQSLVSRRGDSIDARQLAKAVTCAAGRQMPVRGRQLTALIQRLQPGAVFRTTLGGARIEVTTDAIRLSREPGEFRRQAIEPQSLTPGELLVWDGRYEILAQRAGLHVMPLQGLAARLPKDQRDGLGDLPAWARATLPVVVGEGLITCPILAQDPDIRVRGLVFDRYLAAIGAICREPASRRVEMTTKSP